MPRDPGTIFPNFGTMAKGLGALHSLEINSKSFFWDYILKKGDPQY